MIARSANRAEKPHEKSICLMTKFVINARRRRMKIDKTVPFTVYRGTDEQLKKTLQIFKNNGVLTRNGENPANWELCTINRNVFYEDHARNGIFSLMSNGSPLQINYTPEEFHAKFGSKFDYPFDLVGDIAENKSRFFQQISSGKSIIFDKPITFYRNYPGHHLFSRKLFAVICSSINPFISDDVCYSKAWVEVDPPEPKTVTREMNADEVAALGQIWVKTGAVVAYFGLTISVGDRLCVGGVQISKCTYSYSSTATEWKKFEVTDVAK